MTNMTIDDLFRAVFTNVHNPAAIWGPADVDQRYSYRVDTSCNPSAARRRSGTYTETQMQAFVDALEATPLQMSYVEFDPRFPSLGEGNVRFELRCECCHSTFASCLEEAPYCYACCLKGVVRVGRKRVERRFSLQGWKLSFMGPATEPYVSVHFGNDSTGDRGLYAKYDSDAVGSRLVAVGIFAKVPTDTGTQLIGLKWHLANDLSPQRLVDWVGDSFLTNNDKQRLQEIIDQLVAWFPEWMLALNNASV